MSGLVYNQITGINSNGLVRHPFEITKDMFTEVEVSLTWAGVKSVKRSYSVADVRVTDAHSPL